MFIVSLDYVFLLLSQVEFIWFSVKTSGNTREKIETEKERKKDAIFT